MPCSPFITEDPGKQDTAQDRTFRTFQIKSHVAFHRHKQRAAFAQDEKKPVGSSDVGDSQHVLRSSSILESTEPRTTEEAANYVIETASPDSSAVDQLMSMGDIRGVDSLRTRHLRNLANRPSWSIAAALPSPNPWPIQIDAQTYAIISLAENNISMERDSGSNVLQGPTARSVLQTMLEVKVQATFQQTATGYAFLALLASIIRNTAASKQLKHASMEFKAKAMADVREQLIKARHQTPSIEIFRAGLLLMIAETGTADFQAASIHANLLCQFVIPHRPSPTAEEANMVEAIMWYDLHRAILSDTRCSIDHSQLSTHLFGRNAGPDHEDRFMVTEAVDVMTANRITQTLHDLRAIDTDLIDAIVELRMLAKENFYTVRDTRRKEIDVAEMRNTRAVFLVGGLWSEVINGSQHPALSLGRLAVVGWYRSTRQLDRYGLERAMNTRFAVEAVNANLLAKMRYLIVTLSPQPLPKPLSDLILWSLYVGTVLETLEEESYREGFFCSALRRAAHSAGLNTWEEVKEILAKFLFWDVKTCYVEKLFEEVS